MPRRTRRLLPAPALRLHRPRWTGLPQSTFFVLFVVTAIAMVWMHLTIHRMLHAASPELANKFEHDQLADPAAAHESLAEPVGVGATTMERTDG